METNLAVPLVDLTGWLKKVSSGPPFSGEFSPFCFLITFSWIFPAYIFLNQVTFFKPLSVTNFDLSTLTVTTLRTQAKKLLFRVELIHTNFSKHTILGRPKIVGDTEGKLQDSSENITLSVLVLSIYQVANVGISLFRSDRAFNTMSSVFFYFFTSLIFFLHPRNFFRPSGEPTHPTHYFASNLFAPFGRSHP